MTQMEQSLAMQTEMGSSEGDQDELKVRLH